MDRVNLRASWLRIVISVLHTFSPQTSLAFILLFVTADSEICLGGAMF